MIAGNGGSKPVSRSASQDGMGFPPDSPAGSHSADELAANGHAEPFQEVPVNGKRHGK